MKVEMLELPEVMLIEPRVFGDERGFFFESYNSLTFAEATGLERQFVQDNHSRSQRGVLRGLHYQLPPAAQGKLVRVAVGEIFDVAVDIRRDSPNFGHWTGARLSADNKRQLWIPEGFAHGFVTLSHFADVLYKATDYYAPEQERSIRWDDPEVGIEWPYSDRPVVSEKDRAAKLFREAEVF